MTNIRFLKIFLFRISYDIWHNKKFDIAIDLCSQNISSYFKTEEMIVVMYDAICFQFDQKRNLINDLYLQQK